MNKPELIKNYLAGGFREAAGRELLPVENPSTGETLAEVPLGTGADVDAAVAAATEAFPGWSQTPVPSRVRPLFRLLELMRRDEEQLCRVIAAEMGKSVVDARAEMKRAIENLEVACGMPMLQQGDLLLGAAADIDGEVLRTPVGVFGCIAPFNFPAMVPFWFLPYAIASGNTFVLKPSELVPITMQRVAGLIDQSGFPPGVFNLINGDARAAQALTEHPDVAGISFVGSTRVARLVAETCGRLGKRCQAFGSAKNHLVVMPDARLDEVVRNMVTSCYGCAGQRCMASSAIVAVGEATHRAVVERFLAAARQVKIGDPLAAAFIDEPMLLGPVISARSRAFIHQIIETGLEEGARLVLDGRNPSVPGGAGGHFVGPTIFTEVQPGMTIHQTEIFGPVVIILRAESLDQALQIINQHPYGNGASIYTQSGWQARRFKLEVRAGMVGINVGIPAPVAFLPFGGAKASFLSDIKAQGREVVDFFTERKIVTSRFWPDA